jgi:hypothetical protein
MTFTLRSLPFCELALFGYSPIAIITVISIEAKKGNLSVKTLIHLWEAALQLGELWQPIS